VNKYAQLIPASYLKPEEQQKDQSNDSKLKESLLIPSNANQNQLLSNDFSNVINEAVS
jgi:hypothetical protein